MSPESAPLRIGSLHIHPVKSCAGLAVERSLLTDTGLQYDREWMVVDRHGEFLSQRECPRMALVQCRFSASELILKAPGMIALHLRVDGAESETRVRVWNDEVPAFDMGALAGQWFSDYLGIQGLRLAAFDSDSRRLSEARWSGGIEALNAFSDGFPLLVTSTASMAELNRRLQAAGQAAVDLRRLRPNIVLEGLEEPHGEDLLDTLTIDTDEGEVVLRLTKPCPRCPIPEIDPDTAERQPAVGDVLRAYRQHPRVDGAVAFGMNAVIVSGIGRTLRSGQAVRATAAV